MLDLIVVILSIYIIAAILSGVLFLVTGWSDDSEESFSLDSVTILKLSFFFGLIWPVTWTWACILKLGDIFKHDEGDETEVSRDDAGGS